MLLLTSCQPDTGCRAEFSITAGVVLTNTTPVAVASLYRPGGDSVLYASALKTTLRLPLRSDTTITEYIFFTEDATDILHIRHDNKKQFISQACGCVIYHTIDSVWTDGVFIPRVEILNSTVENYPQDNIELIIPEKEQP